MTKQPKLSVAQYRCLWTCTQDGSEVSRRRANIPPGFGGNTASADTVASQTNANGDAATTGALHELKKIVGDQARDSQPCWAEVNQPGVPHGRVRSLPHCASSSLASAMGRDQRRVHQEDTPPPGWEGQTLRRAWVRTGTKKAQLPIQNCAVLSDNERPVRSFALDSRGIARDDAETGHGEFQLHMRDLGKLCGSNVRLTMWNGTSSNRCCGQRH